MNNIRIPESQHTYLHISGSGGAHGGQAGHGGAGGKGGVGGNGGRGGDGGDAAGLFLPFEYNLVEDSLDYSNQVYKRTL